MKNFKHIPLIKQKSQTHIVSDPQNCPVCVTCYPAFVLNIWLFWYHGSWKWYESQIHLSSQNQSASSLFFKVGKSLTTNASVFFYSVSFCLEKLSAEGCKKTYHKFWIPQKMIAFHFSMMSSVNLSLINLFKPF